MPGIRRYLLIVPFVLLVIQSEKSDAQAQGRRMYTKTRTYAELIAQYEYFAKSSSHGKLFSYGSTDAGLPLHLFVISANRTFDPVAARSKGQTIFFINNGIHPGEPDGIDASVELTNWLLKDSTRIPKNVVICIVPVYNVDGALNRGKYSRANQAGPEEYGFRGNAQNLDLNRDCIKLDSRNAQTLIEMLRLWDPDLFIDTHTSDGADYQYTMTLINTQRDKLHPYLSGLMVRKMLPYLYDKMASRNYEMTSYVDTRGETPESGIVEFLETPRFTTGYTTQFNCVGFVSETHMLKPFNDRVWSTYELLQSMAEAASVFGDTLRELRKRATEEIMIRREFPLNWTLDTTRYEKIKFKGYEAAYKPSGVTGAKRLYYDRSKPFTKEVSFYPNYVSAVSASRPDVYIIPQAWKEVIDRLRLNGVLMKQMVKDTVIYCDGYYIASYETSKSPYEGHYVHSNIRVTPVKKIQRKFYKGDYWIETAQPAARYLVEVLDPQCDDSFFAWGFFDAILQQKEWYSDYVFEDVAEELLKTDPELKRKLEDRKKLDPSFAGNPRAQILFIYRNSPYYEKSHNLYPVGRLNR